jgi:cyclophilin family peptidyl-prolyl cis-trans isomerase
MNSAAFSSAFYPELVKAPAPTRRFGSLCVIILFFLLAGTAFAQKPPRREYLVTISTKFGAIPIVLHDQTPLHKANFLKLVRQKYYDGLLFHRVIEQFMIQGGDPNSRTSAAGQRLGEGSVGYTIPAEFRPELFHRKGALAAARDNNPAKASSGNQFYLVQGKAWTTEADLERQVARSGRPFTEAQKQVYRTEGGTPHLDGNYTVFGQALGGFAVIDSIARQPHDPANRPLQDVRMTSSAKKMARKKITRRYGYQWPSATQNP